jgi:hypothetical protein
MTTKCDYCRGSIGLDVHRYWRMRYCCADCLTAYQRRLDKETVGKIRLLDAASSGPGMPILTNLAKPSCVKPTVLRPPRDLVGTAVNLERQKLPTKVTC